MEQTNIRMKSSFKKKLQIEAIQTGKTLQDTIIDYLILGVSLQNLLESNKGFNLPAEFDSFRSSIERELS